MRGRLGNYRNKCVRAYHPLGRQQPTIWNVIDFANVYHAIAPRLPPLFISRQDLPVGSNYWGEKHLKLIIQTARGNYRTTPPTTNFTQDPQQKRSKIEFWRYVTNKWLDDPLIRLKNTFRIVWHTWRWRWIELLMLCEIIWVALNISGTATLDGAVGGRWSAANRRPSHRRISGA